MQDRRISYSAANVQSEIFLKALTVVMDLPGDWHAGLCKVQSIFNYCYVGFLDQFQDHLDWKRISKDVSSCYYQATRLMTFVFDELTRFFAHQYISERVDTPEESRMNDAEYMIAVAIGFKTYLSDLKSSQDIWLSTCGVFMEMAHDVLEFINAYRVGDSIVIEHGYQWQLPIWEMLKQNKYIQITYGQNETLYRDHAYPQHQAVRIR